MDFSTPLIFIIIFVVGSLSLFVVYKIGIKEKSYEEALAEQRQQTNALLGVKPKLKEKKSKKAAKKSKEKVVHQESDGKSERVGSENSESVQSDSVPHTKPHVEFKEEPEEVPVDENVPVKEVKLSTKRSKKVRPILIKKSGAPEQVVFNIVETPIVNHFEENPPKDDFELMRSNSRENLAQQDISTKEPNKEKQKEKPKEKKQLLEPPKPSKKAKQQAAVAVTAANGLVNKQSTNNVANVSPSSNSTKEVGRNVNSKEPVEAVVVEKVEEKPVQAVPASQTNGIVVGNPGKERKKKKSEFNAKQQLTAERDGLINSVRKAELSKTEIQLLIDLLLNKQLEAPAIVDEWSEGKSDPMVKLKKQLAEKERLLAEEQEALVGAQAKLKEVRAERQMERAQIRALEEALKQQQQEVQQYNQRLQMSSQKIQQLQAELNAELMQKRKLLEDTAAMQMQMQQYEVNLNQIPETEAILVKLRNDVEQLSVQNGQMQQIISDKDHQQQHFLMQLGNMEKNLEQEKETRQEIERNLEKALRKENEWKMEISKLNTSLQQEFEEKRKLEYKLDQLQDDLRQMKNDKNDASKIIVQLKSEIQKLQNDRLKENESKRDSEAREVEFLNLTNELSSVKNELSSIKSEMQLKEKKFKTELENSGKNYATLQKELEEQKTKNNELRIKNWKVIEALKLAESKANSVSTDKHKDVDVKQLADELLQKERESHRRFVERLFPEIETDLKAVAGEDWRTEFGRLIGVHLDGLKKQQDVAKLQAQLQHYKNIIDDTEGMLNKLHRHIESEEIKWRTELAAKEAEINRLMETRVKELEKKLQSLERQLDEERVEKRQLVQECQLLKSQRTTCQQRSTDDSTATIERLSEEVNRLRDQLRLVETAKGRDAAVIDNTNNEPLKAQNNSSLNGPAHIEENGN